MVEMLILDFDNLKQALSHVRWIGGPPDAGKSTVAQHLDFA
jgi:hypothetical protein